jgi:hypothetical protein
VIAKVSNGIPERTGQSLAGMSGDINQMDVAFTVKSQM